MDLRNCVLSKFRYVARAHTFFYPHSNPQDNWNTSGCSSLLPSDAVFVNTNWKYGNAASLSIFQEGKTMAVTHDIYFQF